MARSRPNHDTGTTTAATSARNRERDAALQDEGKGATRAGAETGDEGDEAISIPDEENGDQIGVQAEDNESDENDEAEASPPKRTGNKHRSQTSKKNPKTPLPKQKEDKPLVEADPPLRRGERVSIAPKLPEGMVNFEHPNTVHKYKAMLRAAQYVSPDALKSDAAPSKPKSKPKTPSTKNPNPPSRGKAHSPSAPETNAHIAKSAATIAQCLASLMESQQDMWLDSQALEDEVLQLMTIAGDAEASDAARNTLERVQKRRIGRVVYDWPVAKKGRRK